MQNSSGRIWAFCTELRKLVGNAILVVSGIGACMFAVLRQYNPTHSTPENSVIFAAGFALVISSSVRRLVWRTLAFGVPWVALVAGACGLLTQDATRFEVSPVLLGVAIAPPVLAALLLEMLPKSPEVKGGETPLPPPATDS